MFSESEFLCVFERKIGAREQENEEPVKKWCHATLDILVHIYYRSQAALAPDSTWMGDHPNDKYAGCC
jgi:hypothetical protein